jgi:hypothetical protein
LGPKKMSLSPKFWGQPIVSFEERALKPIPIKFLFSLYESIKESS